MEEALVYIDKLPMATPASDSLMLDMLEERFRRIEFLINGGTDTTLTLTSADPPPERVGNAISRLGNLERGMKLLARRSHAVADILDLHRQFPELFHPASSSSGLEDDNAQLGSMLLPVELAQLVLAHAPIYTGSSCQLLALKDASQILALDPVPLARLVEAAERRQRARARQRAQLQEIAELRARSAEVVEKWYESGVLGMGSNWTEWEERLRECEILVRRREAQDRREKALV